MKIKFATEQKNMLNECIDSYSKSIYTFDKPDNLHELFKGRDVVVGLKDVETQVVHQISPGIPGLQAGFLRTLSRQDLPRRKTDVENG